MDFDALLVATPNPLDPVGDVRRRRAITWTTPRLRAALNQAAKATDRTLTWRTQNGRPVAERRAREGARSAAGRPADHAGGARARGA